MILMQVSLKNIIFGDRFREDYGDLSSLKESIQAEGLISPLAVKDNDDDTYTLLAGGRRYTACTELEIEEVPCNVYPSTISPLEMRIIELKENIERKDLTWQEVAKLKKEIHELHVQLYGEKKTSSSVEGWSQKQTSELFRVARTSITQDIQLAKAMESFPELCEAKTKNDAVKMLGRITEDAIKAELVSRLNNEKNKTSSTLQKEQVTNLYMIKDCLSVFPTIPAGSIDIMEIDPPYGINLPDIKEGLNNNFHNKDNYNEVDASQYLTFMEEVLRHAHRVMAENSWLILWFAPHPWFEPIFSIAEKIGFKGTRIFGYWYKDGLTTGQSMNPEICLSTIGEPFFYFRKGNPTLTRMGRGNVFPFKPVSVNKKIHPTERPIELIQEILTTFGWLGARIFVPFLGSGNTILAAHNVGMQAFGTDLSEAYRNSFVLRVHEGEIGRYSSYA